MDSRELYPNASDIYRCLVGVPRDDQGTCSYAQQMITKHRDTESAHRSKDRSSLSARSDKPSASHTERSTALEHDDSNRHMLQQIAANAERILVNRLNQLGADASFVDRHSVFKEVQAWALQAVLEGLNAGACLTHSNSDDVIKLLTQLNWTLHGLLGFETKQKLHCASEA